MSEESGLATWSVVFATLLGPVLAVQTQKIIESVLESRRKRAGLFETLLSTQSRRLQYEHVSALNLIQLLFNKKKDKPVILAWREYSAHLNTDSSVNLDAWLARSDELLRNLLWAMAQVVGYSGEKEDLKLSGYSPNFYFIKEEEENQLRKLMKDILSGESPIKVESVNSDGGTLRSNLEKALEGGRLRIDTKGDVSN